MGVEGGYGITLSILNHTSVSSCESPSLSREAQISCVASLSRAR